MAFPESMRTLVTRTIPSASTHSHCRFGDRSPSLQAVPIGEQRPSAVGQAYLTAPAVMPVIKYRCKKENIIAAGTVASKVAAIT